MKLYKIKINGFDGYIDTKGDIVFIYDREDLEWNHESDFKFSLYYLDGRRSYFCFQMSNKTFHTLFERI